MICHQTALLHFFDVNIPCGTCYLNKPNRRCSRTSCCDADNDSSSKPEAFIKRILDPLLFQYLGLQLRMKYTIKLLRSSSGSQTRLPTNRTSARQQQRGLACALEFYSSSLNDQIGSAREHSCLLQFDK